MLSKEGFLPELNGIACVRDEALAEAVLALGDKVHDAADGGVRQEGLFVQVDNPVILAQHVNVILWTWIIKSRRSKKDILYVIQVLKKNVHKNKNVRLYKIEHIKIDILIFHWRRVG